MLWKVGGRIDWLAIVLLRHMVWHGGWEGVRLVLLLLLLLMMMMMLLVGLRETVT